MMNIEQPHPPPAVAERSTSTRWAVRVQVTGSTGVKGEPFLWSDLGRIGGPLMSATLLESREEARGRARWARDRLMTALDARRVVATPVRVRVTTTVEVLDALQKGDPGRLPERATGPEDGPAPECPIDALAEALDDAYCDGLVRKVPYDWSEMAHELAREIRRSGKREGYKEALKRVADFGDTLHGDSTLSDEQRSALLQAAAAVSEEAPGEAE